LFIFGGELFAVEILNIDFPELVETLIFGGLRLEAGVLIVFLLNKSGSLERRDGIGFGLFVFTFVFAAMVLFDVLAFFGLGASVLWQGMGVVLFEELFFFHSPLKINYNAI
jgi:hypothetical protein